jgi:hypothetical protein
MTADVEKFFQDKKIPETAKPGLFTVLCDKSQTMPWLVEDNRSVLKHETRHRSKGAVLEQIAAILDTMDPPTPVTEATEVTVLVTLQVEPDSMRVVPFLTSDIRKAARDAIQLVVEGGEAAGFVHQLSEDISIGMVSVNTLCVE